MKRLLAVVVIFVIFNSLLFSESIDLESFKALQTYISEYQIQAFEARLSNVQKDVEISDLKKKISDLNGDKTFFMIAFGAAALGLVAVLFADGTLKIR
jgi:uncharacterized membrane protein (DUF106 family)